MTGPSKTHKKKKKPLRDPSGRHASPNPSASGPGPPEDPQESSSEGCSGRTTQGPPSTNPVNPSTAATSSSTTGPSPDPREYDMYYHERLAVQRAANDAHATSESLVEEMLENPSAAGSTTSEKKETKPSLFFGSIKPGTSASNVLFDREQRRKEKQPERVATPPPRHERVVFPDEAEFWTEMSFETA